MHSLTDKTVFITGASAGIGKACATAAAAAGARLVLCARREEKLEHIAENLRAQYGSLVHTMLLDVRDATRVNDSIASLPKSFASIDILINNAGLAKGKVPVHQNSIDEIDVMIDTNVKGLLYVTRAIVEGMVERNSGHVINIGSMAGHDVYPGGTVYCSTKFAVNAITRGLKVDLHGTNIRVSSVDPGMVETDFSLVRFHGDEKSAAAVYANTTPLVADDIAETVMFCATRPQHVNIGTITLSPVTQSSLTMVHRTGSE